MNSGKVLVSSLLVGLVGGVAHAACPSFSEGQSTCKGHSQVPVIMLHNDPSKTPLWQAKPAKPDDFCYFSFKCMNRRDVSPDESPVNSMSELMRRYNSKVGVQFHVPASVISPSVQEELGKLQMKRFENFQSRSMRIQAVRRDIARACGFREAHAPECLKEVSRSECNISRLNAQVLAENIMSGGSEEDFSGFVRRIETVGRRENGDLLPPYYNPGNQIEVWVYGPLRYLDAPASPKERPHTLVGAAAVVNAYRNTCEAGLEVAAARERAQSRRLTTSTSNPSGRTPGSGERPDERPAASRTK